MNKYQRRRSNEDDRPGIRGSFSASLLCADPNGEPDIVGDRTVGDFGVAAPRSSKQTIMMMICTEEIANKSIVASLSEPKPSEQQINQSNPL